MKRLFASLIFALGTALGGPAQAVVINFDDKPSGSFAATVDYPEAVFSGGADGLFVTTEVSIRRPTRCAPSMGWSATHL